MKQSPILCASVVALVALALTTIYTTPAEAEGFEKTFLDGMTNKNKDPIPASEPTGAVGGKVTNDREKVTAPEGNGRAKRNMGIGTLLPVRDATKSVDIPDQAAGGVLSSYGKGSAAAGTVTPGPLPAAISDQAAGGVLSSYGKGSAAAGTVTSGPLPAAISDQAQGGSLSSNKTAPTAKSNPQSGAGSGKLGIWDDTDIVHVVPAAEAKTTAHISDNESPRPSDRKTTTASPDSNSKNFGRYATPGAAPQDSIGTGAPVTVTSTGIPVPFGAGGPNSPTPIMVNPNMGIPTTLAPPLPNPAMQGPLMGAGGAMGRH
jgi:hypothetical protein